MQRNQPTEVNHKLAYCYEDVWFLCNSLKGINLTLNLVQMRPEFTKRRYVCSFLNNSLLGRKNKSLSFRKKPFSENKQEPRSTAVFKTAQRDKFASSWQKKKKKEEKRWPQRTFCSPASQVTLRRQLHKPMITQDQPYLNYHVHFSSLNWDFVAYKSTQAGGNKGGMISTFFLYVFFF